MDEDALNDEEEDLLREIRTQRKHIVQQHRQKKALHGGISVMPRSKHHSQNISDMKTGLESMGMDAEQAVTRARSADTARTGRKRERSQVSRESRVADMAVEDETLGKRMHSSRSRSMSRGAHVARYHCDTDLPAVTLLHVAMCGTRSGD
jgi:nucleolar GTP-binding protein